jgi:hypothetical protein
VQRLRAAAQPHRAERRDSGSWRLRLRSRSSVPPYPNDPSPNNQPHRFYSGQRNRSKSKRFLLSNSTPSFSNKRCCKASPPLRERA